LFPKINFKIKKEQKNGASAHRFFVFGKTKKHMCDAKESGDLLALFLSALA
jgi:hypothetical protein